MRVTKGQALKLFDIVSASCAMNNVDIGGWPSKSRLQLINEIIDQQDDEVIALGDDPDVIQRMRKLLRDEGVVNRGMGISVIRSNAGVEDVAGVQLRKDGGRDIPSERGARLEETQQKAAYDW